MTVCQKNRSIKHANRSFVTRLTLYFGRTPGSRKYCRQATRPRPRRQLGGSARQPDLGVTDNRSLATPAESQVGPFKRGTRRPSTSHKEQVSAGAVHMRCLGRCSNYGEPLQPIRCPVQVQKRNSCVHAKLPGSHHDAYGSDQRARRVETNS